VPLGPGEVIFRYHYGASAMEFFTFRPPTAEIKPASKDVPVPSPALPRGGGI
jgi:hypothetical protein